MPKISDDFWAELFKFVNTTTEAFTGKKPKSGPKQVQKLGTKLLRGISKAFRRITGEMLDAARDSLAVQMLVSEEMHAWLQDELDDMLGDDHDTWDVDDISQLCALFFLSLITAVASEGEEDGGGEEEDDDEDDDEDDE